MKSPRHKINGTYVGGRMLLSMLRGKTIFFVRSTSGVRKSFFYDLLKVTVAKEYDSVHPYGIMVRLGGDQDK
jgi:hypothetical protein